MMKTTRTEVSKASKGIKAIIAATFPSWKGRKVTVIEAGPEWAHVQYVDDQMTAYVVGADGEVTAQPRPVYASVPSVIHHAVPGAILVMLSRFMGQDMGVEIVVPAGDATRGAIDSAAVMVATDALLEGNKRGAAAAVAHCGVVAGIALALAEARAKTLAKGEAALAEAA